MLHDVIISQFSPARPCKPQQFSQVDLELGLEWLWGVFCVGIPF